MLVGHESNSKTDPEKERIEMDKVTPSFPEYSVESHPRVMDDRDLTMMSANFVLNEQPAITKGGWPGMWCYQASPDARSRILR